MMEWLASYAHQVVSYLPAAQRDDTYAEIYDSLCEEYADWRQANPGGKENEFLDETKGHPMRYATQLASEDSAYLVGPRFYFSFLAALKGAATVVVIIFVVIGIVNALTSGQVASALLNTLWALPQALLWMGAAVLGVFVALEKSGETASWLDGWQSSDLVPADDHQTISRGETVLELVVASFALLWVLGLVEFPGMIRHDGVWANAWTINLPTLYWWILGASLVFDIVFALRRLRRAFWTSRLRLVKIINDITWIALLAYAAVQPELLSVEHVSASEFLPLVENAVKGTLLVVIAIIVWDAFVHVGRWRQQARSANRPAE